LRYAGLEQLIGLDVKKGSDPVQVLHLDLAGALQKFIDPGPTAAE